MDDPENGAQEIKANEFIVHEQWSWDNLHNDLALVHLSQPAVLSGEIF